MKTSYLLTISYFLSFFLAFSCGGSGDWRTASKESAAIAPPAIKQKDDIFQIYVARAWSWRGYFAVHPWVSWKKSEDSSYTTASVIGFRVRHGQSAVVVKEDLPDRRWFGSMPELIYEVQGKKARAVIEKTKALIEAYPYKNEYRAWPGPNSNTFVSYLIRNNPDIEAELPPHAIGKDWLVRSSVFDDSPSNTGYQFNVLGVAGVTVGIEEGLEFNLLGLSFGIDFNRPALKLPLIGRLGMSDREIERPPTEDAN